MKSCMICLIIIQEVHRAESLIDSFRKKKFKLEKRRTAASVCLDLGRTKFHPMKNWQLVLTRVVIFAVQPAPL
jgi:hypothetical protein